MINPEKPRLGLLPPRYRFSLNPYPDLRFSRCPHCNHQTGQRTLPLFIYIKPSSPILLNITCRYCKQCDSLICHKDYLEHILTLVFRERDPTMIGEEYIIVGTVEKKLWREGLTQSKGRSEIFAQLHEFKTYEELQMTMRGWFPEKYPPPVEPPPPSTEWVK